MAYNNLDDILKEFSAVDIARITGDTSGSVINIERVEHAISMAESVIDAYIDGRYTPPLLESELKLLKKISLDLCISFLYDFAFSKSSIPNTIAWRRINAFKLLESIQEGKIKFGSFNSIKSSTSKRVFEDDFYE